MMCFNLYGAWVNSTSDKLEGALAATWQVITSTHHLGLILSELSRDQSVDHMFYMAACLSLPRYSANSARRPGEAACDCEG